MATGGQRPVGTPSSTECPVCVETFTTPKVLQCGHTYCHDCIIKCIKNGCVICPTCRASTAVPADGFVTNFTVQNLIDEQKQMAALEEHRRKSELEMQTQRAMAEKQARERDFPYKCNECGENLSTEKARLCRKGCKGPLCAECIVKKHKGHGDSDSLKALMDKNRTRFEEWKKKMIDMNEAHCKLETEVAKHSSRSVLRFESVVNSMFKLSPIMPKILRSLNHDRTSTFQRVTDSTLEELIIRGKFDSELSNINGELSAQDMRFSNAKEKISLVADTLDAAAKIVDEMGLELLTICGVDLIDWNDETQQMPEQNSSSQVQAEATAESGATVVLRENRGNEGTNESRLPRKKCFKCGEDGHATIECPSRNKTRPNLSMLPCFSCGEPGHRSDACINPRRITPSCFYCWSDEHLTRDCPVVDISGRERNQACMPNQTTSASDAGRASAADRNSLAGYGRGFHVDGFSDCGGQSGPGFGERNSGSFGGGDSASVSGSESSRLSGIGRGTRPQRAIQARVCMLRNVGMGRGFRDQ